VKQGKLALIAAQYLGAAWATARPVGQKLSRFRPPDQREQPAQAMPTKSPRVPGTNPARREKTILTQHFACATPHLSQQSTTHSGSVWPPQLFNCETPNGHYCPISASAVPCDHPFDLRGLDRRCQSGRSRFRPIASNRRPQNIADNTFQIIERGAGYCPVAMR